MNKEFTCQQCGIKFIRTVTPTKQSYKYCSTKCYSDKSKREFVCQQCGNHFTRKFHPSHPEHKFCSRECLSNSRIVRVVIDHICQNCGKTFQHITGKNGNKDKKFCSDTCRFGGAQYRQFICQSCKNIFIKRIFPYRLVHNFCSRNCYLISRSYVFKLSGTKPELKCKQILEGIGISFEYQCPIRPKFIVDFCIDNIIIQVDGEYWHGHPRFEPLSPMQISQKKRDVSQDKYLAVHGYKVFRVWENELSEDKIKSIFSSQLG